MTVCVETVIDGMTEPGEPSTTSDDPLTYLLPSAPSGGPDVVYSIPTTGDLAIIGNSSTPAVTINDPYVIVDDSGGYTTVASAEDLPIVNVIRVSTGAGTVERQFSDDLRITGGHVA
ncbi:MAG: hypothetical protein AAGC97_19875, partial [Planctomycetota bacterium]